MGCPTVGTDVRYGTDIVSVEPLHNARGSADLFAIRSADGSVVHARTVVMGVGLRARVPGWATESARCFHNHDFLFHLEEMPSPVHQRFVVVGAGQSAAEVVQYLHTNYPQAEVHNVFGRFGYSPADDSPYANRIFDPAVVDELHAAPVEERERLLTLHKSTNYAVVAPELIEALYAAEYRERVRGPRRLFMRRASEVLATEETAAGIDVEIRNNLDGLSDTLKCDAVVSRPASSRHRSARYSETSHGTPRCRRWHATIVWICRPMSRRRVPAGRDGEDSRFDCVAIVERGRSGRRGSHVGPRTPTTEAIGGAG